MNSDTYLPTEQEEDASSGAYVTPEDVSPAVMGEETISDF